MIRSSKFLTLAATIVSFAGAEAQAPSADASARLREVLPPEIADRVVARIAEARARELPAAALENRALKFAAKGVPASDIENAVREHAGRMEQAQAALRKGSGRSSTAAEIEAGAEVMRKGVDGAQVSDVARNSADRRMDVPFTVISSLMDRGLPSDAAIAAVLVKLGERATDSELLELPNTVAASKRPSQTGTDLAATKRPTGIGGRPAGAPPVNVPANPGRVTPPAPVQTPRP